VVTTKQIEDERLFKAIIEQLKLPLLHIARKSESAKYGSEVSYNDINSIAEMSIKMIDSYLLTSGQNSQISLDLEPVSISSVLNSAANNLSNLAKLYNCNVELRMAGKYEPVMTNRAKLEAAYTMLGYSFIEANVANNEGSKRGSVLLTGYRTSKGLVAGVFSPEIEVTNQILSRSLSNFNNSKQVLPEISQSSGAGIIIANSILNDLANKLRVAHYKKLSGLGANLISSRQMQLI
jgi:hypothetical protein